MDDAQFLVLITAILSSRHSNDEPAANLEKAQALIDAAGEALAGGGSKAKTPKK